MKKQKKYKNRFNDFCAEIWMGIHATSHQARALRRGMQDAIMNPLEDTSKSKKALGVGEELSAQLEAVA